MVGDGNQFNINNLVVRENLGGSSAISAYDGADITITGCFTAVQNYPQISNTWKEGSTITDNSTGPCTGMIGNGDPAVKSYSDPAIAGCGLPSEGFVRTSTTYNLIRDCQQTGSLYIPRGVTVTINGNHHTISAASDHIPIYTAGTLTARDFVLTGSTRHSIQALLRSDLLIENAIFRGNSRPILLADHTATFRKVLLENNSEAGSGGTVASALRILTQEHRDTLEDYDLSRQ